ncbi:MAG: imidazolonepropionase [Ignavibacterium sp.]|nr:MAG: imidazolonepropionase [Ignavibacterium sp.]
MIKLLSTPSQILTINTSGKNLKRGKDLSEVNAVDEHSIVIEDDIIKDIIPNSSVKKKSFDVVLDLDDKIVLPGLIECHTHTAFTGSRADEFRQKLDGIDYEKIAESGGGINSTVRAVRKSSFEEIVNEVKPRIDNFIAQGITTLEIKSGYGLDFENEIKLLQVINYLNEIYAIDIIPTFLGAHTYPPEHFNNQDEYIEIIKDKMLPHIAKQRLARFCDGFCEATAFSADEIKTIFASADANGFKLRLHTEQFNAIGGLDAALSFNAVSVDHLEVLKEDDIKKLANSDTVAVLLPGVSFFLNYQYAPARKLIDNNVVIALATDFNPGSSHISSLSLIMSFAALKMKMSIEETINAVTINAAKVLCLNDKVGSIEIGKRADFSVFNCQEYANIVYDIGKNLNCITMKNGDIIYNSTELSFN